MHGKIGNQPRTENTAECIFCQILERIREANPDFPIDYVLHALPDHEQLPKSDKNFLIGVVACLAAIWTERVGFKNKPKRLNGEEWEELNSQEFMKLVEKVSEDFIANPDKTHLVISYIDASNVHSRAFNSYLRQD
ncbi:MAG: hypothetical protein ACFFD4_07240 [Candidatus Odinarchaeota archaeon]